MSLAFSPPLIHRNLVVMETHFRCAPKHVTCNSDRWPSARWQSYKFMNYLVGGIFCYVVAGGRCFFSYDKLKEFYYCFLVFPSVYWFSNLSRHMLNTSNSCNWRAVKYRLVEKVMEMVILKIWMWSWKLLQSWNVMLITTRIRNIFLLELKL